MTATLEPLETQSLATVLQAAQLLMVGSQLTLLELGLWQALRQRRRRYQQRLRTLIAHPPSGVVDDDDCLSDELLSFQRDIHKMVRHLRTDHAGLTLWERWLKQRILDELTRLHDTLGALRVWIMEHDADYSPVIEDAFDTPESLLAALERDAA
jgi:hypothetical protein